MNYSQEVDNWFESLDHPQKDIMLALRESILKADRRISECIKWKTPTFYFNGNLASINPAAKKFTSLMFHRGAEIPGNHPSLEGDAKLVRTMKFEDIKSVKDKSSEIKAVVKAWCDWRS